MISNLEPKGVRVTVARTGRGAEVAKAFARAGARAAVHDHSDWEAAEQIRTETEDKQGVAASVQGDALQEDNGPKIVAEAAAELGRSGIVVNHAGAGLRATWGDLAPTFGSMRSRQASWTPHSMRKHTGTNAGDAKRCGARKDWCSP